MPITPRVPLVLALASVLVACGPGPAPEAGKVAAAGEEVAADAPPRDAPSPASAPDGARSRADPPAVLQGIPGDIPPSDPGVDTPPVAAGAQIEYACESGASLRIAYEGIVARVAWTDGGVLVLSRGTQQAGGGESYSGDGHVLVRRGNVVELGIPGGRTWRCMEAASSA